MLLPLFIGQTTVIAMRDPLVLSSLSRNPNFFQKFQKNSKNSKFQKFQKFQKIQNFKKILNFKIKKIKISKFKISKFSQNF